jgi:hypothetical protein
MFCPPHVHDLMASNHNMFGSNVLQLNVNVATPLWGKCEDETRTPKIGNLESSGTLETLELDCRVKPLRLEVFFISLERSWSADVESDLVWTVWTSTTPSYGRKKGRESNWQFDSRPLKVMNKLDSGMFRWSLTHCWKALEKSYKFSLDFIPIKGLSWELWAPKVPGVQTKTISELLLGSPGTKSYSDVGAVEQRIE